MPVVAGPAAGAAAIPVSAETAAVSAVLALSVVHAARAVMQRAAESVVSDFMIPSPIEDGDTRMRDRAIRAARERQVPVQELHRSGLPISMGIHAARAFVPGRIPRSRRSGNRRQAIRQRRTSP